MFLNNNFSDEKTQDKILKTFKDKIDIIVSDMAENTTGNKTVDSIRTNSLCSEVINFSLKMLTSKGSLVCKLFMGEDFLEVKNLAKKNFKNIDFFKPESSRSESKETYIICSILKTL
jgi:23S rRNA (uridine2552-2'-O)-methyltransferase